VQPPLARSALDEAFHRADDISRWPLVTYVDDIAEAMARAKAAAGDSDVMVHGAKLTQLALAAGVLDELEIHQVPVLLGEGHHGFRDPCFRDPSYFARAFKAHYGVTPRERRRAIP
jgi:dihydrofolate reductase